MNNLRLYIVCIHARLAYPNPGRYPKNRISLSRHFGVTSAREYCMWSKGATGTEALKTLLRTAGASDRLAVYFTTKSFPKGTPPEAVGEPTHYFIIEKIGDYWMPTHSRVATDKSPRGVYIKPFEYVSHNAPETYLDGYFDTDFVVYPHNTANRLPRQDTLRHDELTIPLEDAARYQPVKVVLSNFNPTPFMEHPFSARVHAANRVRVRGALSNKYAPQRGHPTFVVTQYANWTQLSLYHIPNLINRYNIKLRYSNILNCDHLLDHCIEVAQDTHRGIFNMTHEGKRYIGHLGLDEDNQPALAFIPYDSQKAWYTDQGTPFPFLSKLRDYLTLCPEIDTGDFTIDNEQGAG